MTIAARPPKPYMTAVGEQTATSTMADASVWDAPAAAIAETV